MIIQTIKHDIVIIVWFGGPGVPGPLGYTIPFEFSMVNKQIKFSQMIIQATESQNMEINVLWGTRGPGTLGLYNSPCILNVQQTISILSNYNPSRQAQTYSN